METITAVVTGGARNIRLATGPRLARDDFRIIVVDIVPTNGPALQADAAIADFLDRDAAEQAFSAIAVRHPVGVLFNNVGFVELTLFNAMAVDDFYDILHLNMRNCLIAARAFVPCIRARGGGRIVMNTSRDEGGIDLARG